MKVATYASGAARHASPLRYPGGKAGFANFLQAMIECNDLSRCEYFEPFAGGAGAALELLRRGVVSKVHLNDADFRVFAFWNISLRHARELARKVLKAKLNIDEWHRQHEVCVGAEAHNQMDVAFATFYMNRCNRSGVLTGAGPIGGYTQKGDWKLDVRFNREDLAERITRIGKLRGSVNVSNRDALVFLRTSIPTKIKAKSFAYLDPPYVAKGQRLYLNAYGRGDHRELAKTIRKEQKMAWVVSYDNTPLVKSLYASELILPLPVRYTLQRKRSGRELLIIPRRLVVPSKTTLKGKPWFPNEARRVE